MDEQQIERRARELFELEKTPYERWACVAVEVTPGKPVVAAIPEDRREHFRKLARGELEQA